MKYLTDKSWRLLLITLGLSLFISSCSIIPVGKLDPHIHLGSINQTPKFRIIQIGDSHTAGEYFTQTLRNQLQSMWGDGGVGWVYPAYVSGQRESQISYNTQGWSTQTSRLYHDKDLPFGGVLAQSQEQGGKVTLNLRRPQIGIQAVQLAIKPMNSTHDLIITDGRGQRYLINPKALYPSWQYLSFHAQLPLTFESSPGDHWNLGFIDITNQNRGLVLSAFGINGAQLSDMQRWRRHWLYDLKQTKADVVILSFGTNEAFNPHLKINEMKEVWLNKIRQIKKALPSSQIVIVGAPESLSRLKGRCGTRAPKLNEVQILQKELAQITGALYWSWQQAMGGVCSMKRWRRLGLGRPDGVHFTAKGYERVANQFAQFLLKHIHPEYHP